jgi:phosphoglycerate-specific signal transduction histidine kinase
MESDKKGTDERGTGIDLDDGFGPFFINKPFSAIEESVEFLFKQKENSEDQSYAASIVENAKAEYSNISKGKSLQNDLLRREKELQNQLNRLVTKSRNPKVREKYKKMRTETEAELKKIQDELIDLSTRKK